MEKVITISGKNYNMKSSAFTQFSYKDFTGRSFLKDLQGLVKLKERDEKSFQIEELDDVTELLLKIAFVMVKEADSSQANDYKDFLQKIDNIYDDERWIQEVLELACTPISRRLQNDK